MSTSFFDSPYWNTHTVSDYYFHGPILLLVKAMRGLLKKIVGFGVGLCKLALHDVCMIRRIGGVICSTIDEDDRIKPEERHLSVAG